MLYERSEKKNDTIIDINGVKIGNGGLCLIAGPCAVESEAQLFEIAESVKASGAAMLRGGAFKPRTSPYDFQGLGAEGIRLLLKARERFSIPVVTEITEASQLELFKDIDIIQVGARNMQNYELLKALGRIDKPVLLKRGWASTIKEFLFSAEYLLAGGNEKVILCERGIRGFGAERCNTLDLSSILEIKRQTHLPVIADPSHAAAEGRNVASMALAAIAAQVCGLMIEIHNDPECALCDGNQAINCAEFSVLAKKCFAVRNAIL